MDSTFLLENKLSSQHPKRKENQPTAQKGNIKDLWVSPEVTFLHEDEGYETDMKEVLIDVTRWCVQETLMQAGPSAC